MAYSLNLYHDQLKAGGAASPLPPAHRLLYTRFGSVRVNGEPNDPVIFLP